MGLFDVMVNPNNGADDEIKGVAIGVVTNNEDPEKLGRVKVKYPWRETEDESYWVRVATFMGGAKMGGYFLPEVNDEVLLAFENGDIDHPFVIGSLWSGKMNPPEENKGKNDRRLIKSRSGHQVILDDTNGKERIEIKDKSGNNMLTIDTSTNTIEITSGQDIKLQAKGKITLDCMQLELKSKTMAKLEAGGNLDLKATGNATLKGALVMIN